MAERTYCKWKNRLNLSGHDLNGTCQICGGHVMFEGHERCPFLSGFRIYDPLVSLVTEEERQYSLQKRIELGYPIDVQTRQSEPISDTILDDTNLNMDEARCAFDTWLKLCVKDYTDPNNARFHVRTSDGILQAVKQ